MARKRNDKPAEQAALEQSAPDSDSKQISKTEAIRRAVAAGIETPEQGVDFIQKNFGLELSRQHFSATRSKLKGKDSEKAPKAKPGRKPKATVASGSGGSIAENGLVATPPKQSGDVDLLDAMEALKPMIASLGAEKLKRVIDLLE